MAVRDTWPDVPNWLVYVIAAEVGVVCMALSLLPLAAMPDPREKRGQDSFAGRPGGCCAENEA